MAHLKFYRLINLLFLLAVLANCDDNSNSSHPRRHRIDEMMPDELEDDAVAINNDGLGGGPEDLVDDIVIGRRPFVDEVANSRNKRANDNCTNEILASLSANKIISTSPKLPVTWSTVINSYSFDPVKNQLTIVADSILSWNFEPQSNSENSGGGGGDACKNVDTLLVEPASLIWTPRFVFLNNLDTISNLLPSDVWDKWPAVVHIDKHLVTWHFATRFTVACSFQPSDMTLVVQCPVKIAGVTSAGLLLDSVFINAVQSNTHQPFIFKTGELSILAGDGNDQQIKFTMEANAADDLPALVLLARLDLTNYLGGGSSLLQYSFRVLRIRILSFQTDDGESSDNRSPPRHFLLSSANIYCLFTFFGSFLVFLLSSVSITLVILSWHERQQQIASLTINEITTEALPKQNPPSYATVIKNSPTTLINQTDNNSDQKIIVCCSDHEDDPPLLLTDNKLQQENW